MSRPQCYFTTQGGFACRGEPEGFFAGNQNASDSLYGVFDWGDLIDTYTNTLRFDTMVSGTIRVYDKAGTLTSTTSAPPQLPRGSIALGPAWSRVVFDSVQLFDEHGKFYVSNGAMCGGGYTLFSSYRAMAEAGERYAKCSISCCGAIR
jgi:hypothetical protein